MQKKNIKLFFIIGAIILCCFFSTVAYSAVYSTMNITGLAYARVVKDVRITDFKLNSSSTNTTSSYEEFGVNTISSKFNLLDSSSSIVFDVEVTNYGSSDVGILQLIGDVPTGLSYEIINYNLKDKICDDTGKCNQMAVKTFQIKFTGIPGEYEVNLELDFRTYHKVTYTDITNNNYPTEVIDGGNLNITFTENLKKVSVLSDGTEIGDYDQINSGQTITIENISNDIEIKRNKELVARLVSGEIDEVGSEVCIKDECFYIIGNDGSKVTMLAKYNLHVGNSVDENNNVTPLANPTGKQDDTAKGNDVEGKYPFIGTVAFSKKNAQYSGSIVEGYVNNYDAYLITQGVTPIKSRLITKDELINLGCDSSKYTCSGAPNWVYATSYWTETANAIQVWVVSNGGRLANGTTGNENYHGVRPVIEISVDEIYVPIKAKVVSGDYDTVGSEVCIGEECFYVISSTEDTVTMLAKYNLHVGEEVIEINDVDGEYITSEIANPTGIQDSTAKGEYGELPFVGVTPFADYDQMENGVISYSGSYIEILNNDYGAYLSSLGITLQEIRLITIDELDNLGCVVDSCHDAPSWVYSTSYWTGSFDESVFVYAVNDIEVHLTVPSTYDRYGVRPVITISKDYF